MLPHAPIMDADTEHLIRAARDAARAVRETCAETTALIGLHRELRSRFRDAIESSRAARGHESPGEAAGSLGYGV